MKNKKLLIYSVLGLALMLSSCGGDGSSENSSSENSSEFISIEETGLSGTGSKSDPYVIGSKKALNEFASLWEEGKISQETYAELSSDIDYGDDEWKPLGTLENPFSGKFDGKNHVISNIKISEVSSDAGDYALYGFLGYAELAKISNLKFDNFELDLSVFGKDHVVYAGGLVGYGDVVYIDNVHMSFEKFEIRSLQNGDSGLYAGGLGGFLSSVVYEGESTYYVNLVNSSVKGDINVDMKNSATTISYAAGLSAVIYNGYYEGIYAVNNCYFDGNVTSGTFASGLVANLDSLGSVVDSYAKGSFIKATDTGGAYSAGAVSTTSYETALIGVYTNYDEIVAPPSTDYYESYAGEIAAFVYEDAYAEGTSLRGTAIFDCYTKSASTVSADNVLISSNISEPSASFFKDTLKYSDKVWNFDSTYPTQKDTFEQYEVNVTLNTMYSGAENETVSVFAGDYNAEFAIKVENLSYERENYSYHGYYYDEEATVSYRFYVPINKDTTLYAGWTDLSNLIGTYNYECYYYGDLMTTGKWKFDEEYFYWISPDNAIMQYEYYFDGNYIFIGEPVVGPMGDFVGGYSGEIFTYNEDGSITAYDVNDYSAVYTGVKSNVNFEIPNYQGKGYLGTWYSVDVELNLYFDGNTKAKSYKTSTVYYYGGFDESNSTLDISVFDKVSGTFKYDETNDVLYSNSNIFAREQIDAQYSTSDNSVLVAVSSSKTYVVINNNLYTGSIEGTFEEGSTVTINGVSYKVSGTNLLSDEETIPDEKPDEEEKTSTYLGTWSGKVGVADVTIIIYDNGTLSYNDNIWEYTVSGNVISAYDLTLTYNENNQSLYVSYLWDGYEELTGTFTTYAPFKEEVDQNKYVGTYVNQHGATLTLDAEGNGVISMEGAEDRTFKYEVTSDGFVVTDFNDPSGVYDIYEVTVLSDTKLEFNMEYDYTPGYIWTFTKTN